jgi:hypothetical protein
MVIVIDDSIPSGPYAGRLEKGLREMMQNTLPVTYWGRDNRDINLAIFPAAMGLDDAGPSQALWPAIPACALPTGSFLHSARLCDAPSNFEGGIVDAVACAVLHLPASGLPPRPLETIRALFAPGGPAEVTQFRRKEAPLLLAIVSSEDDPDGGSSVSATRDVISTVVDELDYDVLVGVVAPATATGLAGFSKSFGGNGAFTDIAADQWSALRSLTDWGLMGGGRPECLDWPLADADPDADGIQPECVGTEIHQSSAGRTENILPTCPAGGSASGSCWRVSWEPKKCGPVKFQFLVDVPPPACLPDYVIKYTLTCATQLP